MPEAVEEVPEVGAERRGAGDGVAAPGRPSPRAACEYTSRSNSGELQLAARTAREPASTAFECSTATSAAARKILPLPPALRLLLGRVVDLLEHAGNREQERRLEARERRQQLLGVGLVTDLHARRDAQHGDEAGEDVRRRDEEQGGCAARLHHHLLQRLGGVARELHEVRVGEHAALRPAGGAGGVDQRADVAPDGQVPAPLDLLVRHVDARGGRACRGRRGAAARRCG